MGQVTITGASDDLIVLDGAIREEFNFYSEGVDDKRYIAFSDGTVLSCNYDKDGIWRFCRVADGSAQLIKDEGLVERDTPDKITLTGDIRWALFGDDFELAG